MKYNRLNKPRREKLKRKGVSLRIYTRQKDAQTIE